MSDRHTLGLPPGAVLSLRMSAAHRDGQETAAARERPTNPWDPRSADPRDRVLAQMWQRGYSAGNPVQ